MTPASAWPGSANSGTIDRVQDKTAIPEPGRHPPHEVAVLVYDGVALFELAVTSDVFGTEVAGPPLYRLSVCGAAPSVTTDAGFRIEVPYGLDRVRRDPCGPMHVGWRF